jgi:uncharacterized protein (DUF1697 family)
MPIVVFLRGVNVGGHRPLRPAALARELSEFDVVNIGAAGTYVVHGTVSQARLRAEVIRRLPFEAELMTCRARDLLDLARVDPFPREASGRGVRRFVSVLARRPRTDRPVPCSHPAGRMWQVRIVSLRDRFALSLWRRTAAAMVYPNEVVEREFGVPATTRTWDTVLRICHLLRGGE